MQKQGPYSILLNYRVLKGLLSLGWKGYFIQRGWLHSYDKKLALSPMGEPIPWLSYSFLDFIADRLHADLKMFEYGAGNSTFYFAKQVKFVYSVEHNQAWYAHVNSKLPANVLLSYIPLEGLGYQKAILQELESFDIVLIDGRQRVACVKNAVEKLTARGVVVLDDAEREKYAEVFVFMKSKGFRYIPFSGIAIGAIHDKNTVVFYKDQNCLGI